MDSVVIPFIRVRRPNDDVIVKREILKRKNGVYIERCSGEYTQKICTDVYYNPEPQANLDKIVLLYGKQIQLII